MGILRIKNEQGEWVDIPAIKGSNGANGQDGEDGFSPIVTSSAITGGTRVSIQDSTLTMLATDLLMSSTQS